MTFSGQVGIHEHLVAHREGLRDIGEDYRAGKGTNHYPMEDCCIGLIRHMPMTAINPVSVGPTIHATRSPDVNRD